MALNDLIATMGARNYETMRRGWLPTKDERQARTLKDLNIQSERQKVDYEPERQNYLRQKQKSDLTRDDQTTKLFEQKYKKLKTAADVEAKDRKLGILSNHTRGAYSVWKKSGKISQAQNIFRNNYTALKEAGDDDQDKLLDRFLDPNTSPEEAEKLLEGLNAVLPKAQAALDKEASRRGGSLFEKMLAASESSDPKVSKPAKDYIRKASGLQSSEQFDESLDYKKKQARDKGTVALGSEYKKEFKPFIHTANQITKIENALRSGDNAVMDLLVTGMLTNIEGSGIKAKSMFDIHNAPLGNIMERIKDEVGRFVGGVKTDFQKQQILSAITDLKKYNDLVLNDGRSKYRSMARSNKYDASLVVPFETFKEVQDYLKAGYWTKDQATDYLEQNQRLVKNRK